MPTWSAQRLQRPGARGGAASSSGGTNNVSNNASSSRVSRISLYNSSSSSGDISQLYFDLSSLSDF